MTIVDFKEEANKRNKPLKELPSNQEDSQENIFLPDQDIYEGDYIYKEDRVNVKLDTAENKVFFDIFDIKTNESYTSFEVDTFTMYLLSKAFLCLYTSLEDEYSIN